jgi:hypothetical protein
MSSYEARRQEVEERFIRMRPIPSERRIHASPSGHFELVVDTYAEPGSDWSLAVDWCARSELRSS